MAHLPAAPPIERPTTEGQERLNQELNNRTRDVRIVAYTAACLRLVTAPCVEQSDEWASGRRYPDMFALANGASAAHAGGEAMPSLPGALMA